MHQACNFKSPFRSDRVSDETHQARSACSSSARFPMDFMCGGKIWFAIYKARISALQERSAWLELCTAYGVCLSPVGHTAPVLCVCEEPLLSEPLDEHFGWASMIAVSFKCRCQILRRVNKGTVSVVFILRYTFLQPSPVRERVLVWYTDVYAAHLKTQSWVTGPDGAQLWSSSLAPLFWNVLACSPGHKKTHWSIARPPPLH